MLKILRRIGDWSVAHAVPRLETDDPVNVEAGRLLEISNKRVGIRPEDSVVVNEAPLALECEHGLAGVSLLYLDNEVRPCLVPDYAVGIQAAILLKRPN